MPSKSEIDELRRAFQGAGFRFGLTPARLNKELLRAMGQTRFDAYLRACDEVHDSGQPQRKIYEQPQSYAEANLLMSFQADVALEASAAAYGAVAAGLRSGDSVMELGCWTGVLAAHVARIHPQVSVRGVDALASVITMAAEKHELPNLTFTVWDYSEPPPPEIQRSSTLLAVFGIDFLDLEMYGHRVAWPLDIVHIRESASYHRRLREARPYFANWRAVALDRARLVAVLRLPSVYRLLAVLDAAREAGWSCDLGDCNYVQVGTERFPLLVFRAEEGPAVIIEDVLAWSAADDLQRAFQPLVGAAAWVLYRALGPKVIHERAEHRYDDGNTSVTELGVVGGLAYAFYAATVGDARLTIGSREQLDQFSAQFSAQYGLPRHDFPDDAARPS